jgi:glutamine synthetase
MSSETNDDLQAVAARLEEADVHTVEVAIVDTYGHLRGKRVPVDHFLNKVATRGCHIADAIYIFDIADEILDNPYINMEQGFLDTHLVPQLDTLRIFTHRPGYAIVFAESYDPQHQRHPLAPISVLHNQIDRCADLGFSVVVATELEFFITNPDGSFIQEHVQYSSLTDRPDVEVILADMRAALVGAGIPVESSNPEYGPGQIEINVAPADAMTTAHNTALYKSIVKEVAEQHRLTATFMPKPWAEQSGNGMHVHTSLSADGANAFGDSEDEPNELMGRWLSGLVGNATELSLLGSPLPNGFKRVRPYTFAPTHIHWGLDNRSVLCRCTVGQGGANRVEFRAAGADANPYLVIAGILAAGLAGLAGEHELSGRSDGDKYDDPGESVPLPADVEAGIAAYEGSDLAAALGEQFSDSFLITARAEAQTFVDAGGDPFGDDVTEWEFERYRTMA